MPPASGKNAIFRRSSPATRSVSLPIHSPVFVENRANTPAPRSLVGFQENGIPLDGSRAAIPGRSTAPGPAESVPYQLFIQRWCPPT